MEYKICKRCVMDTSDPEITFDRNGICKHCHRYDDILESRVFKGNIAKNELKKIVSKIKKVGLKKDYDCIVGVSGGVDSTYVAYLVKELGLRPLAIHFDNGWNSELAVSNIEKVLDKLDIDLFTYVIDWDMFRDLQKTFLKGSTPDGEVPTDHAITALLFKEASKRGIKYIISGMNFSTESMSVRRWSYGHSDWLFIKDVYKKNGGVTSLKGYPKFSLRNLFLYTFIKRIKVFSILNYVDYDKEKTMDLLKEKLDWTKYEGKHYESVYTRFYQGYVLPVKFNIDKRIGHLSDLIRSGQINRDEALSQLKLPSYPSKELLNQDLEFMYKKFNYSKKDFESIMKAPTKSFLDYKNLSRVLDQIKIFVNYLRSKKLYTK